MPSDPTGKDEDTTPRRLTDTERYQLNQAEQTLIKQCMTKLGWRYWVWLPLSAEESRPIGPILDDPAWSHKHGYGSQIDDKYAEAKRNNPNMAYRKTLTSQRRTGYLTALAGGPKTREMSVELPTGGVITSQIGGCEADARERLYGDRRKWFKAEKTATNLTPLYAEKLTRAPQYTAAVKSWSRCMRTHGYDLASPEAARNEFYTRILKLPSAARFKAEVQLSVAEATCARTTRLRKIGQQTEDELRSQLPAEIRRETILHGRLQQAALERARDIVTPRDSPRPD